ncbi:hypothetical protein [Okeania hirsuta]|uniref:hypothetical protein n=1 Tax=Okeania hirsuta TaxID=1458930 RepID=UPI001375019F|nr:hypothetical protein [Okeania hirsuta]
MSNSNAPSIAGIGGALELINAPYWTDTANFMHDYDWGGGGFTQSWVTPLT